MAAKKKVASNSPKGAKTTAEKIKTALTASNKANKRVAADKWAGAYSDEKNPSAIKAKNVRKALDTGKTAMRAKNIESRRNKPLNITFKDEREMAKAMAKANAAKAKKPLTKSEKAFVENQKAKARTVKKTGVYPNTAN